MNPNIDIDYVIPYVDGTDQQWLELYCKNKNFNPNKDNLIEVKKRFSPNILFKYQFRGIEKFAPWINTVHLLVQSESQVPEWINRKHVHIVTHDQFIPKEFLPTYNSSSFECFLHNIPELATCFIYANDDTYILNEIQPHHFFDGVMPINSLKLAHVNKFNNESFQRMNMKISEFVCKQLNIPYQQWTYWISHHCQKSMNKVILEKIYSKFEDYIRSKVTMFRCDDNLSQAFFTAYYNLSTGLKWTNNNHITFKRFDIFNDFDKIVKFFNSKINKYPQLFCLNNNDNDKDIAIMGRFELLFPYKSKFEN